MKQSTIMAAIIIIGATMIGFAAYKVTKIADSPVEQMAEAVLRTQGIDIDFSPDME